MKFKRIKFKLTASDSLVYQNLLSTLLRNATNADYTLAALVVNDLAHRTGGCYTYQSTVSFSLTEACALRELLLTTPLAPPCSTLAQELLFQIDPHFAGLESGLPLNINA